MRRRTVPGQGAFDWRRPGLTAGVDEAGRGPLAGPVVAAAVILDPRHPIDGLADSKALAPARREALAVEIRTSSLAWGLGWADAALRVLLARGDHDAALELSERLLKPAEATHRMRQVIEILVLQALAYQGKKDIDQALAILERALSLAQPEGYVRTFLDEGEPMAKLLYQAKSHRIGYAAELLAVMGGPAGVTQPPAQPLIEPLSVRELEVLRLSSRPDVPISKSQPSCSFPFQL